MFEYIMNTRKGHEHHMVYNMHKLVGIYIFYVKNKTKMNLYNNNNNSNNKIIWEMIYIILL
jgi:hypothetical protein